MADVPGLLLPGSRGHEHATALFDGFGGMLSFDVAGGVDAAEHVMKHSRIPIKAVSLGKCEAGIWVKMGPVTIAQQSKKIFEGSGSLPLRKPIALR